MSLSPYHYPCIVYIKNDDPTLPTFNFDPVINPISAYKVFINILVNLENYKIFRLKAHKELKLQKYKWLKKKY